MRNTQQLNDNWLYLPEYAEGCETAEFDETGCLPVRLPHTNIELPLNNFDERDSQFISCYRRRIQHAPQAGKRLFLHFEGVMTAAKIYLNGAFLQEHLGGYTPFTVEMTGLTTGGEDVLAVVVDSHERNDIPPFGHVIDYLTYGGIYREVWLEVTNEAYLQNLQVKPEKTQSGWRVNTDAYLDNAGGLSGAATLRLTLTAPDDEAKTHDFAVRLSGEMEQTLSNSFEVSDVLLWGLDQPNLYTLSAELMIAEKAIDETVCRFGFREAKFTPEGFFLNGERVKLRGLNRHQSYPYVGYAMPKRAQEMDAELLKSELGVNLVRTSHYPQSRHFLNRCDELGLLVFEEIPGWQYIGGDEWKKNTMTALREMIQRDWNHPSIVLWGVRINESQDDDAFYHETNAVAHTLDVSRQTGGVRNFANSHFFEDVYTYNDFVHNGKNEPLKHPKDVVHGRVPYMVTEHNGHMFPTKKIDCEEKRVEHALRHLRVLDRMYGDEQISGSIGWDMNDYNTHKDFGSGDKICYHGVMDMFRLPKFAAAAYRSQLDGELFMEVASGMNQGERTGSNLSCVYVFTNCDEVKLYKNGDYIGTYLPDCKTFPNLPHPPVAITDLIGELLMRNEHISKQDADRIKRVLAAIVTYGDKSLPLRYKLAMGYTMLKLRYSYEDAVNLYTRYVAGWGSESTEFLFEGFRKGQLVASAKRGAAASAGLRITPESLTLEETDTYDVCRIVLEHVDQFGAVMPYSVEAVRVLVIGAGERIGPELVSLTGGSTAFWVKTTGEGEILVSVESERFGKQTLRLTVRKKTEQQQIIK